MLAEHAAATLQQVAQETMNVTKGSCQAFVTMARGMADEACTGQGFFISSSIKDHVQQSPRYRHLQANQRTAHQAVTEMVNEKKSSIPKRGCEYQAERHSLSLDF